MAGTEVRSTIAALSLFAACLSLTWFVSDAWAFADIEIKLTADDGAPGDALGHAVDIQSRIAVVGARRGNAGEGSAYVYENISGIWMQIKELDSPTPVANGNFGFSLAVDGDTLVVGQRENDEGGTAFVFERDEGGPDNWGFVKELVPSDRGNGDRAGWSVAVSGDTIVVGAPQHEPAGCANNCGAVYVFERDLDGPDNWGERIKLVASDISEGKAFGRSVTIDGDYIAVGAPRGPEVGAWPAGSAYIFSRNDGGPDNWGQVQRITASDGYDAPFPPTGIRNESDNDAFGEAISIDDGTLVVGAPKHLNNGSDIDPFRGAAYVFEKTGAGADPWTETTKLTASDMLADEGSFGGEEGHGVSLMGDSVIIGDRRDAANQGAVYRFGRNEGGNDAWGEIEKIIASDGSGGDRFGFSTATDGLQIIIGAIQADNTCMPVVVPCDASGASYLYQPFIDIGVAGGGFSPPKRIDLSKCTAAGTCAKPIKIKVKNFEQGAVSIDYEVTFDASTPAPGGTILSAGCAGTTPVLVQRATFSVPDCTVEFPPGGVGTFSLNLHTFPSAGIDDDETNNEATKNTRVVP